MTRYIVSSRFIKNTSEFNRYTHSVDRTKSFEFQVDYCTGSFSVDLTEKEFKAIDKEKEGEFRPFDYDGAELIETDDSWSVFLRFDNPSIPENEQREIEEKFYEDGIEAFENLGYDFDESYYVLYGALNFEPVETKRKSKKADTEDKDDIAKLFGL